MSPNFNLFAGSAQVHFGISLLLSRARKFFCIVNMKTGYSRFPQAGVPRLDFRYRSNANDGNKLPRYYIPTSFWRKLRDSLRDIQIITCFKFHFILTLIFCHNVAITPGLQTTVSSVVWSACFCCCLLYRLQADSQPVRIPFHRRQSKTNRQKFACSFCLAEAKGFEPLRLLGKRFSRPPRYDHFDKLPFI